MTFPNLILRVQGDPPDEAVQRVKKRREKKKKTK